MFKTLVNSVFCFSCSDGAHNGARIGTRAGAGDRAAAAQLDQ